MKAFWFFPLIFPMLTALKVVDACPAKVGAACREKHIVESGFGAFQQRALIPAKFVGIVKKLDRERSN